MSNNDLAKRLKQLESSFLEGHGLSSKSLMEVVSAGTPYPPPLATTPCANHQIRKNQICTNDGRSFCSACFLVKYCSPECQTAHWPVHRKDCKSYIRSENWLPEWMQEHRSPTFVGRALQVRYGANISLWGNMPATDILNVHNNEGSAASKMDFNLAFMASGDLRNVIKTVNSLPEDYEGSSKILVNDFNPLTVYRNLFILAILSLVSDEFEAAEHALHVWYSVFLPASFVPRVFSKIISSGLLNPTTKSASFSETSTLHINLSEETRQWIIHVLATQPEIDPDNANQAFNRVMNAPERVDYRDRYYSLLTPSHRLAFREWRRFGLVLPFGAPSAHMNYPNKWLFTKDGELLTGDSASPLQGWDITGVLNAGAKHGRTRQEDLMGCLFFYVRDQLVEFTRRLRRFKISIILTDHNATELPKQIKSGAIPPFHPSIKFDRIDTSNIIDREYVGIQRVLQDWSPLLSENNPHAAIVGYFMNWIMHVPDGSATSSEKATDQAMNKMKGCKNLLADLVNPQQFFLNPVNPATLAMSGSSEAFHDHSKSFAKYLTQQRVNVPGVELRRMNKILPHRVGVRVGDGPSALPRLTTKESWYHLVALGGTNNTERYAEWVRSGK